MHRPDAGSRRNRGRCGIDTGARSPPLTHRLIEWLRKPYISTVISVGHRNAPDEKRRDVDRSFPGGEASIGKRRDAALPASMPTLPSRSVAIGQAAQSVGVERSRRSCPIPDDGPRECKNPVAERQRHERAETVGKTHIPTRHPDPGTYAFADPVSIGIATRRRGRLRGARPHRL